MIRRNWTRFALVAAFLLFVSACDDGQLSDRGGGPGVEYGGGNQVEEDVSLLDTRDYFDVCVQGCELDAGSDVEPDVEGPADVLTDTELPPTEPPPTDPPPTEPPPAWACSGFDCPTATTTASRMVALDGCNFELALQQPIATGQDLADRLIARLESSNGGSRQTLNQVMGNLNRQGVSGLSGPVTTRLSGLNPQGFRWNNGDNNVTFWYPQGITGSSDAAATGTVNGRRLLMTSWYHKTDERPTKGARISLADITDLNDVGYRHLLLVDPIETAQGPDFKSAEYDSGNALHAGGIVWYGDYLYVVDTVQGIRIYDLSRIFRPSHTNDQDLIGVGSGRSDAHGYLYAIPRIARYRLTSQSCRVRFAFIGLDRDSDPPAFVTGEYFSDHPSGKAVVWPLDASTHLLETRGGTTRASEALLIGQTRAQGALRVGADFYISSSSQEGSNGRLYINRPGQQSRSVNWVYGAEDLYYERGRNLVWTPAEHPGARDVVAIPRP